MDIRHSNQLNGWLKLVRDTRFSCLQKHQLLKKLNSPDQIYRIQYSDLCALLGVRANNDKNRKFQSELNSCSKKGLAEDLLWLEREANYLVCWGDEHYPELLAQITDPPVCLFASGNLQLLSEPKVSVVGSRRPTPAGAKITQTIASELARLGIVVTSGMALGIDGISHRGALDINEPTIAVMGCGLDIIYPSRHRSLFEKITEQGLVLSEYPIAYPPTKYTFPQRNRIVSGLSYGVVIVEAADKSGTLITARLAMEQNREVFVVPGATLNPQYVGSHRLIKQGAMLVTNAQDILHELSGSLQLLINEPFEHYDETASVNVKSEQILTDYPLLTHIDYEPTSINEIISGSGLTASEVSSMLLILEVEGLVATTGNGCYLRVC